VVKELKRRGLDLLIIAELRSQLEQFDVAISDMVKQRKDFDRDLQLKRKCASDAKGALKKLRESKNKMQMPVFCRNRKYSS
jgi:arsenate reductase-like glutaredoxin family protein